MDYEKGITEPSLAELNNIASVLCIDANKLYDEYYQFLTSYSELIKQIRSKNHLLQRELGDMLGVSRRTVERWEHGRNQISRKTWLQLKSLNLL